MTESAAAAKTVRTAAWAIRSLAANGIPFDLGGSDSPDVNRPGNGRREPNAKKTAADTTAIMLRRSRRPSLAR